ncbi:uncharacterized protein TRIVIDRAFT_205963 [Trichoderma virens Gv29-8]|uniref:BZIP domain-containing protein n=1 Tax=Hypocrea virens (strain Gv29-8 / FGSC 10586) TaxID=413071 RepID=G9N8R8_HYPVG|nr:uncharacterized protein TRIVIDRAFT_205963 [Trichoderma virens Gv29-8]EHK17373.1 hypothetical protein TRIVIDRAFT_205963 [Trichoderma virens Gv29-8]UKZ55791.1 hypothetical protein TrVGV298_009615 [Trichoderma virens]
MFLKVEFVVLYSLASGVSKLNCPESDQDPFHNDPNANLQNNPRQGRSPLPQTALPSTGPTPLAFTRQDLSPNAYQAPPTTTQDQRRTFTQAFGSGDHYSQAHGNPWQRHVNTPTRVGMVTPTRQERDTPFQRPISAYQGGSTAVSPFGFTGLADVPQSSLFTYGSMSQRRVDVQAPIYRQSQRIPMSQNSTNRNVETELRDEIAILREESASLREENASLREVMAGMDERQAAAAGDIAALWRELRRRR